MSSLLDTHTQTPYKISHFWQADISNLTFKTKLHRKQFQNGNAFCATHKVFGHVLQTTDSDEVKKKLGVYKNSVSVSKVPWY